MFRKLGVQTRTGVVVRAYETFIRMWQMETDAAEQQESQGKMP